MKKLLCLSLAALVSTSSMGADWELSVKDIENGDFYIDTSSIDNSGLYTKVWVKRIGKKLKTSKPKDAQESNMLYEMSCSSKQIRYLSGVFYNFDGSMGRENTVGDWNYVPPDSIFEALMQRVCN